MSKIARWYAGKVFGGGGSVPWYRAGGAPAPIAVYAPKGAASLAASYVNLINPGTNDAAPGTAPDFAAATGWTFNGINDNLLTGYTPAAVVTRSIIVRISGGATDVVNRFVCGARDLGGSFFGIRNTNAASKAEFFNGTGTQYTHSTNIAAGVLCVAGLDAYIDGVDVGNITAGTYPMDATMRIGNCSNISANLFSGNILAFAEYNITLSAAQVAAISTAMAALTA